MITPDQTANMIRGAAANAGSLQAHNDEQRRKRGPESSALDVWTHTGEGVSRRDAVAQGMLDFTPAGAVAGLVRSVTSGVQRASLDGVDQAVRTSWDNAMKDFGRLGGKQGTLQKIGLFFGALTSLEQAMSAPFGMIPFPAFPALRILDLDIGLPHAHAHPPNLTPPNPVPIPLPSAGPVIPIPFLSGAMRTVINGMPAARCGDMGLGIWCGGYVPMFEVFLGSATVWIEGARAARTLCDITNHCIFTARPKAGDPPVGTFLGSTITGSSNVLIGGIPLPSFLNFAMGQAFKAVFAGLGRAVRWLRSTWRRLRSPRPPGCQGIDDLKKLSPHQLQELAADPHHPFTARQQQLHDLLNDTARFRAPAEAGSLWSAYPTTRVPLGPEGVHVDDLVSLTRRTGLEHGVIVDDAGDLFLVRGGPNSVPVEPGDHVLAHTHPHNTPPSRADIDQAAAQRGAAGGGEHTGAAVGRDGSIQHYGPDGPTNRPAATPVDPNSGRIDGLYRDPATGKVTNAPPNWQKT